MFTTSLSLLRRLRDPSDATAWPRFVDVYTPLLFSWAQRLAIQGAEAADLVQQVFVRLVEVLPTFDYDPKKSFRGFLRTICTNCWTDFARRRAERLFQAGEDQLATLPASADEQFWELEYRCWLAGMALAIVEENADAATQAIIREVVMGGGDIKEVAARFQLTENAVSIRKLRMLVKLRQALSDLWE